MATLKITIFDKDKQAIFSYTGGEATATALIKLGISEIESWFDDAPDPIAFSWETIVLEIEKSS